MKLFNILKSNLCLAVLGSGCFFFQISDAEAAACCARSSATPILIIGDDEAQMNLGFSIANVAAEPDDSGVPIWKTQGTSDTNRTYRLEGATLISDRFQLGASLSLVNHSIGVPGLSDTSTGLGDFRFSLGYEVLPYWSYSAWRPQGYLYSVFTIPTGRSIYQSRVPTASDVTGGGFYSVSIGNLWVKRWTPWDVFLVPEVHYSLPRTFQAYGDTFQVVPGFGGSVGLGGGFSPGEGELRLGFRVQPRWDQARKIPSLSSPSSGSAWIASCDVGLDASYLLTSTDTLMISYTDQTWLGPAANTNLSRIVALNFQHRWER